MMILSRSSLASCSAINLLCRMISSWTCIRLLSAAAFAWASNLFSLVEEDEPVPDANDFLLAAVDRECRDVPSSFSSFSISLNTDILVVFHCVCNASSVSWSPSCSWWSTEVARTSRISLYPVSRLSICLILVLRSSGSLQSMWNVCRSWSLLTKACLALSNASFLTLISYSKPLAVLVLVLVAGKPLSAPCDVSVLSASCWVSIASLDANPVGFP